MNVNDTGKILLTPSVSSLGGNTASYENNNTVTINSASNQTPIKGGKKSRGKKTTGKKTTGKKTRRKKTRRKKTRRKKSWFSSLW